MRIDGNHPCTKSERVNVSQLKLNSETTVVPGFSVLGFRALPGFRALCTGNQIWIYVINLPGFSALPGFKAPFHGDGQSALNPGTTVFIWKTQAQNSISGKTNSDSSNTI